MEASAEKIEQPDLEGRRVSRAELVSAGCVLAAAGCLFWFLFNRETTLSYSIGYNLYGAERILEGQVPYLDFHTLYPPATVYLNAVLFKVFGVRLYTALFGVFVFKALTTTAIYLGARQVMPRGWAIAAAVYSIVWLRPNGPFKTVPMHYGALMLALALYCMLRYLRGGRIYYVGAGGFSLGLLALFKHNIGAYALAGFLICLLLDDVVRSKMPTRNIEAEFGRKRTGRPAEIGLLILGFVAPIVPVMVYLGLRGALRAMVGTLVFGPGEFLVSRLAGAPSPLVAALFLVALVGFGYGTYAFRLNKGAAMAVSIGALAAVGLFCLLGRESWVSELLFYAPVIVIGGGIGTLILRNKTGEYAWPAGPLVVAAAAAFMETFPRFAREQVIAAMPFVGLLLMYLVYSAWRTLVPRMASARLQIVALLAMLPVAFLVLGLRFFHQTFFRGALTLRSDTELGIDRGRGVYFPAQIASEVDEVTRYVQQHVAQGGYVFPESYAGSAFLFLADRKNPSGAQFWGGVGVSSEERGSTLAALEQKRVDMIITSTRDLEAEKYPAMRDYIAKNFRQTAQVGEVVILERKIE